MSREACERVAEAIETMYDLPPETVMHNGENHLLIPVHIAELMLLEASNGGL